MEGKKLNISEAKIWENVCDPLNERVWKLLHSKGSARLKIVERLVTRNSEREGR